jgi:hypothetical protein
MLKETKTPGTNTKTQNEVSPDRRHSDLRVTLIAQKLPEDRRGARAHHSLLVLFRPSGDIDHHVQGLHAHLRPLRGRQLPVDHFQNAVLGPDGFLDVVSLQQKKIRVSYILQYGLDWSTLQRFFSVLKAFMRNWPPRGRQLQMDHWNAVLRASCLLDVLGLHQKKQIRCPV